MTAVTPLDAEIATLEAELSADPRVARLDQLKRLRRDYLALPTIEPAAAAPSTVAANGSARAAEPRLSGRRRSPERQQALDAARELLRGKTAPTRTADISAHLEARGITIGGTDPVNNLSAMLSHVADFRSHGRDGWTLNRSAA
jgi:hypothetical protein